MLISIYETLPAAIRWKVSLAINKVCPSHWASIPIEDVAIIQNGYPFESKQFNREDGVPLIRIRDVGAPDTETYYCGEYSNEYLVNRDDILIGMDGEFRCRKWTGRPGLLNQRVCRIIPTSRYIDPQFLYIFLQPYLSAVEVTTSSVTVKHLSSHTVAQLKLALPPLNEQRRIVAKIEALKARSQRVKEELGAIPALLEQFRQSVLAAAFRGDLTADWREKNPDVEPASVLLERIRAERRRRWEEAELEKMKAKGKTPKDDKWKEKYKEPEFVDTFGLPMIPETWTWTILDNICQKITDGEHLTPPITGSGVYLLSAKDVRDGYLDFSDTKFVSEEFAQKSRERCNPEKDDILVVSRGATVGRTCRVKTDNIFCLMGSVLLFKLYQNCIKPSIVEFAFKSPYGIKSLSSISGASAQQAIYIRDMRNFAIPVPPLLEQQEIISCIQTLLRAADTIEQQYQEAQAYLDQLNQSILAKAFRGELVPQDPNDEPASVLLERIRAEREKLDTKKKAKGKTKKKSRKAKPEPAEPEQLNLPGFE